MPETMYGYKRTHCACELCKIPCNYMPGFLAPDDLLYLAPTLEGLAACEKWALEHLTASPGALVLHNGEPKYINTLVPSRKPKDLACHWLTDDGKCSVHEHSPFGCAFHDMHMDASSDAARRSEMALRHICSLPEDSLYKHLWHFLWQAGKQNDIPTKLCHSLIKLEVMLLQRSQVSKQG